MAETLRGFQRDRWVGKQTIIQHAYRFRIKPVTPEATLAQLEDAKEIKVSPTEMLATAAEIQTAAFEETALTGGWAAFLLSSRNLRFPSAELDFLANPVAVLAASDRLGLEPLIKWGCWVGFQTLPSGQEIRVEINPTDCLPRRVCLPGSSLKVVAPSVLIKGKLLRTSLKGPQVRDQLDIASVLLGPHLSEEELTDLRTGLDKEPEAREALLALGLPGSVSDRLEGEEMSLLSERVNELTALSL